MMGSQRPIRILTINGGSSSIKLALFEAVHSLRRVLEGKIERIGLPEATFIVKGLNKGENFSRAGGCTGPCGSGCCANGLD